MPQLVVPRKRIVNLKIRNTKTLIENDAARIIFKPLWASLRKDKDTAYGQEPRQIILKPLDKSIF